MYLPPTWPSGAGHIPFYACSLIGAGLYPPFPIEPGHTTSPLPCGWAMLPPPAQLVWVWATALCPTENGAMSPFSLPSQVGTGPQPLPYKARSGLGHVTSTPAKLGWDQAKASPLSPYGQIRASLPHLSPLHTARWGSTAHAPRTRLGPPAGSGTAYLPRRRRRVGTTGLTYHSGLTYHWSNLPFRTRIFDILDIQIFTIQLKRFNSDEQKEHKYT